MFQILVNCCLHNKSIIVKKEYILTDLVATSERNLEKAYEIINELKIEDIWKNHESQANLVGSIKTRLIMDHLDIDFHIYSEKISIANSFAAIGEIAESIKIVDIQYKNLLMVEDKCLEWHLFYKDDEDNNWMIDLIHIRNDSKYVGKFERVAEKINKVMTEERRRRILRIKHEAYENGEKVVGIAVYESVIEDNINNYSEYIEWAKEHITNGIIEWEPK